LAQFIENSENGEGIRAGEAGEGCLIDDEGAREEVSAFELGEGSWGRSRVGASEVSEEGRSEGIKNEGTFTRATYPCDAGQVSKGDGGIDCF
jgi:hypothetical protein